MIIKLRYVFILYTVYDLIIILNPTQFMSLLKRNVFNSYAFVSSDLEGPCKRDTAVGLIQTPEVHYNLCR